MRGAQPNEEKRKGRQFSPIPACAGLNRVIDRGIIREIADPRMRGAQPPHTSCANADHCRSPHARGSTGVTAHVGGIEFPIPACAGLNRSPCPINHAEPTDPRMRGAQPRHAPASSQHRIRSPHARGSTVSAGDQVVLASPIPACAGLNRVPETLNNLGMSDPRMRGAQPPELNIRHAFERRSPHARGSTGKWPPHIKQWVPIPACAGLNRTSARTSTANSSDPRMRGAQPANASATLQEIGRSPHARGSTVHSLTTNRPAQPDPACAGLNRRIIHVPSALYTDPRMRGAQPN